MADKKLTELTEATDLAAVDLIYVVDVSDTTDSVDGTSKGLPGNIILDSISAAQSTADIANTNANTAQSSAGDALVAAATAQDAADAAHFTANSKLSPDGDGTELIGFEGTTLNNLFSGLTNGASNDNLARTAASTAQSTADGKLSPDGSADALTATAAGEGVQPVFTNEAGLFFNSNGHANYAVRAGEAGALGDGATGIADLLTLTVGESTDTVLNLMQAAQSTANDAQGTADAAFESAAIAQQKANAALDVSGASLPFDAGDIAGAVTLDRANGAFQKAALTGDVTLDVPASGSESKTLRLWLVASGADRTLDLNASILLPTDSALSLPKTLESGKLYIVLMHHNSTNWMLVSLVGGY